MYDFLYDFVEMFVEVIFKTFSSLYFCKDVKKYQQ